METGCNYESNSELSKINRKSVLTIIASLLCMTLKLAEIHVYENVKERQLFLKLLRTHLLTRGAKCASETRNGLHSRERVWVCDLVPKYNAQPCRDMVRSVQ
jgi:hypothetical protein